MYPSYLELSKIFFPFNGSSASLYSPNQAQANLLELVDQFRDGALKEISEYEPFCKALRDCGQRPDAVHQLPEKGAYTINNISASWVTPFHYLTNGRKVFHILYLILVERNPGFLKVAMPIDRGTILLASDQTQSAIARILAGEHDADYLCMGKEKSIVYIDYRLSHLSLGNEDVRVELLKERNLLLQGDVNALDQDLIDAYYKQQSSMPVDMVEKLSHLYSLESDTEAGILGSQARDYLYRRVELYFRYNHLLKEYGYIYDPYLEKDGLQMEWLEAGMPGDLIAHWKQNHADKVQSAFLAGTPIFGWNLRNDYLDFLNQIVAEYQVNFRISHAGQAGYYQVMNPKTKEYYGES